MVFKSVGSFFCARLKKGLSTQFTYFDLVLGYHVSHFSGLTAAQGIQNPEKPILFIKPTTAYISEGQKIKVHSICEYLQLQFIGLKFNLIKISPFISLSICFCRS